MNEFGQGLGGYGEILSSVSPAIGDFSNFLFALIHGCRQGRG